MCTTCVVHDEMQRRRGYPLVCFLMLTVNSSLYFIIRRRRSAGRIRKHGSVMPTPNRFRPSSLHDLLFGCYVLLVVPRDSLECVRRRKRFLFFVRLISNVPVVVMSHRYNLRVDVFKLRTRWYGLNKTITSHFNDCQCLNCIIKQ